MASPLIISLITVGDPNQVTGGYLYQRRLADFAPEHGARIVFKSLPSWRFPLPLLAGDRVVCSALRERPQAIVIDSIAAAYLAPVVRRFAHVPIIAAVHQAVGGIDHSSLRSYLQAQLDLIVYRRVALLLVDSQSLADELVTLGLPKQRVRSVPPGRDVVQEIATEPSFSNFAGVDLRQGRSVAFLCVSNWLPRKGILPLLDAFAQLPHDVGTLHLVGQTEVDPSYGKRVRRRLDTPELSNRVVVHGAIPLVDVAVLYQAADIFVLASTVEPYGTVYGEAMTMGLPVVGVNAGNLPNLATDGVEASIVFPGDTDALAQALLDLARDEPLRRRMGEAARQRALTRPTWAQTAATFFGAVKEVVEAGALLAK